METTENIARKLIDIQFPVFRNHPIVYLGAGVDNANFRLGSEYLIRLPIRKESADLIENEIRWLPFLEPKLPLKIPAPILIGQPTDFYPWRWTINPWFEGNSADMENLASSEISTLIHFLKTLHQFPPDGCPVNPYRGVPLISKANDVENRMKILKPKSPLITTKIEKLWNNAIAAPISDNDCLIHGDLHPKNILVKNQKIVAVIDWGDITRGDPATDLAICWMAFNDTKQREIALHEYGASQSLINRAIGWAIFFGTFFLETELSKNNLRTSIGNQILSNLNEE